MQKQLRNIGRLLAKLLPLTLRLDPLMIIGPTVEFWKGNALQAEHGCYLRVMVGEMGTGIQDAQIRPEMRPEKVSE